MIDIPALRKILEIQPFHFTGRYTKLSELLRDMPSDEVLFQLDRERGNLTGGRKRHRVSNQDLYLLQQRPATPIGVLERNLVCLPKQSVTGYCGSKLD